MGVVEVLPGRGDQPAELLSLVQRALCVGLELLPTPIMTDVGKAITPKYGLETRNNVVVVQVQGSDDNQYAGIPRYSEEQLGNWNVSGEERAAIKWIDKLRFHSALQVSLDNSGRLTRNHRAKSMDELLDRVFDWLSRGSRFAIEGSIYENAIAA